MDRNLPALLRLVVRVDAWHQASHALEDACSVAESLGATAVLLGRTEAPARDQALWARWLLDRLSIPVLLTGRADVAIAAGAAGVLLTPDDAPAPMIRRIAPRAFLVGAGVERAQDVENSRGADFWVIGPWRLPGGRGLGPGGFTALARRAEGRPCIASGASVEDLPEVLAAGGVGILVKRDT